MTILMVMHSIVLQRILGDRSGRKRSQLPEIHNPNFQAQNPGSSGGSDLRALLVFTVLAIAVLVGYRYLIKTAAPTDQMHLQSTQQTGESKFNKSDHLEFATAPVADPNNTPAVIAAVKIETGMPSPKPQAEFGWLTFVAKPLYLALRFLYEHGVGNWGWAIIIFTVIFNSVTLWPRFMSLKSSLKMMRVQPKVDALKKRYAHLTFNDPRRTEMNEEMVALYKAEGANMYGGCLPMLLQMPLLFAYMRVLQNAVELRHATWLWLSDLSLPDPLHILPIVIIGSMFLVQYITPMPGTDPNQRRILAFAMPLIMGFSLWRYASGLALYWATCNLLNLVFQLLINRSDIGREMHAIAVGRASEK